MATKRTTQTKIPRISNFFVLLPPRFIVLIDGIAVGPFDTGPQALAWAYDHCKDDIYQLKQLITPPMGI